MAAEETYTIDPNHTLPVFEVNHLGFSTQRGRFDKTAGKIQLDIKKKTGAVEWTIEADSLDMGSAKWNEHLYRVQLETFGIWHDQIPAWHRRRCQGSGSG